MEVWRTVPVKLDVDSDDAALLHNTVEEFLFAANLRELFGDVDRDGFAVAWEPRGE